MLGPFVLPAEAWPASCAKQAHCVPCLTKLRGQLTPSSANRPRKNQQFSPARHPQGALAPKFARVDSPRHLGEHPRY